MKIQERIDFFVQKFVSFSNWEERYQYLIDLGKTLERYPEEFRLEKFKIKGCQSQVWLYPELSNSKLIFFADSDSYLVKGLLALVLEIFSDEFPKEILKVDFNFINRLGLSQNLTQNRTNGLLAFLKQIKLYALVLQ